MNRRSFVKTLPALAALAASPKELAQDTAQSGQSISPIALPKPETDGGKSVLAALKDRRTIRDISSKDLPLQVLSNVLWAAFGVNRENGPRGSVGRTAATASNSQEIDIYAFLATGVYLYDAVPHRLMPVAAGDHRADVGGRGRAGTGAQAPLRLVYVADLAKYAKAPFQEPRLKDPEFQKLYYGVATGMIAGNVYLFAASTGLAAWFHNCNREALGKLLGLGPEKRLLFAQTVGYPS